VDGQVYWLPESTPPGEVISPSMHLLTIYDEYKSGYKDRRAIGETDVGNRLMALGNALSYIIVVNGQIVGTWRRVLKASAALIETTFFKRLSEAEEQAVAAALLCRVPGATGGDGLRPPASRNSLLGLYLRDNYSERYFFKTAICDFRKSLAICNFWLKKSKP
jgi:hypothetical protein